MVLRYSSFRGRRDGFTLIELLVVIAIIALLAAILFPVFARARENARRTACQSNMKQIGMAIAQYNQDFDERMPSGRMEEGYSGTLLYIGPNWQNMLYPYVKNYQMFRCPSNLNSKKAMGMDSSGLPAGQGSVVSYSAPTEDGNGLTQCAFGRINKPGPVLSTFLNPSQTIAVVEANGTNTDFQLENDYYTTYAYDPAYSGYGGYPYFFSGHLGTANYLFADGHVKSLKPMATIPASMGGSGSVNMWARDGRVYQNYGYSNPLTQIQILLQRTRDFYNS